MILSTTDYRTKRPNDHEPFPQLSILENNFGTVFVATAIGLNKVDGEMCLSAIDDLARSKGYGEASSESCE